jgi:hypothetical protein
MYYKKTVFGTIREWPIGMPGSLILVIIQILIED